LGKASSSFEQALQARRTRPAKSKFFIFGNFCFRLPNVLIFNTLRLWIIAVKSYTSVKYLCT
jgi:hypothetical protein